MRKTLYADAEGDAKSVKIKNEARGEIELSDIYFSEYETLSEFTALAPNDAAVLDFINSAAQNKKLQKIRAQLLAIPKDADLEVAKNQIREGALNPDVFTTAERATAVNKVKAAKFDKLEAAISRAAAENRELSLEEIQELMASA